MSVRILAAVLALAPAACSHTVAPAGLADLAGAVGAVHRQTDIAFSQANRVARDAAIDRFVASGAPGLTEAPFAPVIEPATAEAWSSALDGLERYATLLASLTDPRRGSSTTASLAALGSELGSGTVGARIDPGVGAGFAALAGILVDAQAQRGARGVMARTDPAVRRLLSAMADAVGPDQSSGLRGTVWSAWTASLGRTRAAYAQAATGRDAPRQRALVTEYLTGIDRRDADMRALASLAASLRSLADAHSAAAAGSAPGQQAALRAIERRIDATRASFEALERVVPR